jgi:molecular chaperone IbpA
MTEFKIGNISFGPSSMKELDKFFVGYDQQFDRLAKMSEDFAKNVPNYPPYNIKKTGDNTYVIEVAVAGFTKSDIEITVDGDKLVIKGSSKEEANTESFLFKGIGLRDFTRTFALNDQVEIKGAAMLYGLLQIALERLVPEHRKAKKVDISDDPSTVSKHTSQYLTEEDL